ncbi:MAG: HypC/HybG/HupF family hydrogenase formation chaperone [archaeon GB-1867-035]|nr:HypC/HybG/HupF family hydrogenase formation chaperone [Candidatus Culexmicrobium profundum]
MCLAVPAKIISIQKDIAKVDFGGVQREVVVTLIEEKLKPGDYVLIHAGFAIQKIDEKLAMSILEAWNEILSGKN